MSILRLSTFWLTIVLFTMGALILPVNIVLADDCKGSHKKLAGCDGPGGGDSGEGGKALLFVIDDIKKCNPMVSVATSFGQVTWAGNVLWDPEVIHVHFKLQLKDVDPEDNIPILGNNDGDEELGRTCSTGTVDFPLCEGGDCNLTITVKQNGQGRTSGVLQLPGCDPDETTTVWVTVTVTVDNGNTTRILRSTPVTIVLPPNEVGVGQSCTA